MVRIAAPQMTGIQKLSCCDTATFPTSEKIGGREDDAAIASGDARNVSIKLAHSFVRGAFQI